VDARNRRMELRFRPDDGYCKPACGDRHQTAGFLLRVRIKKSRREKVEKESQLNNNFEEESNINFTNSNISSHSNKDKSSNNINNNNAKDESVRDLTDKITNCSVNSQSTSTKNNENNDLDKNQPPTFDRQKYENLSDDHEYELPKLKVLGRVDTEFRFTSKFNTLSTLLTKVYPFIKMLL
jgi:general transcription factor 3C polypeptide 5 (transcription factor C subunit 1)